MRIRFLFVFLALFPATAFAQTVRGTVVEGAGGSPVPGVLVALVGEDGTARAEVLSDGAGRYLVRAGSPGRYTLRAERVGYRPVVSPELALADGQTLEHTLRLAAERLQLPAITASVGRRCATRADPGEEVALLWTEARKALRSAAYTTQLPYRYRFTRRIRQLDPSTLITRSERTQTGEALKASPFVTVPLERLAEKGYVELAGDTAVFHAPDAEILLSEAFLDTHCFHAQPADREHAGMVGLAFAPVATGERVDVRGVLWMDAGTAELRVLEYGYTGGRFPGVAQANGRVEFRRLPGGGWIVSRWRIRMPTAASRFRPNSVTLPGAVGPIAAGFAEEVGEVVEIRTAEGDPVALATLAAVTGTVFDSTRARPLPGARVQLTGTDRAATTDSAGRFTLADVAEGLYSLGFTHPRLDSLRYTPEPVAVAVVPPQVVTRDLAIPPLGAVLTASCRGAASRGTGWLAGVVSEKSSGRPVAGIPVRAAWQRPGEAGDSLYAVAVSDDAGVYRFCDLPLTSAVRVTVPFPHVAAGEVRLAAAQPGVHDVVLDLGERAGATGADVRQRGRVTLRVVDALNSRPIAGVEVRPGGGVPRAVSDRRGLVTFADVPTGSYGVELRHADYGRANARITVRAGVPVELEIRFPKRAVTLEPIVVQARRVLPGVFNEDRRGRRLDIFTREDIDRLPGLRDVGQLVMRLPGVRVKYDDKHDVCIESTRLLGNTLFPSACESVQLIVDDVVVGTGTNFAAQIPMSNIESVIFLKPTEAFVQYGYLGDKGVLLIYTRGNGPTARRDR